MEVLRDQILSLEAYEERRAVIKQRVLFEKKRRRVQLGEQLTFLFENEETVRYQVQEMLRIEGRTREEDALHELRTYNELLGGVGELGCTLLIEIDDPVRRDELLRAWLDLPSCLYLGLESGERCEALFDPRQVGEDRLSAVQYLKFSCGSEVPSTLGVEHPQLRLEVEFDALQRAALAEDLVR